MGDFSPRAGKRVRSLCLRSEIIGAARLSVMYPEACFPFVSNTTPCISISYTLSRLEGSGGVAGENIYTLT